MSVDGSMVKSDDRRSRVTGYSASPEVSPNVGRVSQSDTALSLFNSDSASQGHTFDSTTTARRVGFGNA